MEHRPLGQTGWRLPEIALGLPSGDSAPEIVTRALLEGCDLFVLPKTETETVPLLERFPSVQWMKLSGGRAELFRGDSREVRCVGSDLSSERVAVAEAAPTPPGPFSLVPYSLVSMDWGRDFLPRLRKEKHGIVAGDVLASGALQGRVGHAPRGAVAEKFRFLQIEGRTLAQAAVQFVLANEYVSCAVAWVADVPEAEEVLGALSAEPLTFRDLEQIFEIWSGRCEP